MLSLVLNPKHVCSAPLTLLDWRLGARTVDTSDQCLVHPPPLAAAALNFPRLVIMSGICGSAQPVGALGQPPRGHLLLPTSFLQNPLHITMDARGACHRHLQLRWWPLPPSTSPTSVVAAVRPTDSTPRGPAIDVSNSRGGRSHHRCLQLQWWPLPDLPSAPPRGPAINVSNSGCGRCRTYRQHPPEGSPSTSPPLVVAVAGPDASNPRGACHRRLQLWWWPLPDPPTAPPRGARCNTHFLQG
jgi:hypothetical protein